MIGVSLVPAIAMSAGTLCLLETPRWLVSQGREAEALTNLRAVTYYGSDPDLARARALHNISTIRSSLLNPKPSLTLLSVESPPSSPHTHHLPPTPHTHSQTTHTQNPSHTHTHTPSHTSLYESGPPQTAQPATARLPPPLPSSSSPTYCSTQSDCTPSISPPPLGLCSGLVTGTERREGGEERWADQGKGRGVVRLCCEGVRSVGEEGLWEDGATGVTRQDGRRRWGWGEGGGGRCVWRRFVYTSSMVRMVRVFVGSGWLVQRHMLSGVCVPMLAQLSGIEAVTYYSNFIWKEIGIENHGAVLACTVIMGVFKLSFVIIAAFSIDRWGRRPLLIIGNSGMASCLLALCFSYYITPSSSSSSHPPLSSVGDGGDYTLEQIPRVFATLLPSVRVILFVGYVCFFSYGVGPLQFVIPAEMFPQELRAAGVGLAHLLARLVSATVAMTYLTLMTSMGASALYALYASLVILSLLFAVFILPETQGRSLEHVACLYCPHMPAQHIHTYKPNNESMAKLYSSSGSSLYSLSPRSVPWVGEGRPLGAVSAVTFGDEGSVRGVNRSGFARHHKIEGVCVERAGMDAGMDAEGFCGDNVKLRGGGDAERGCVVEPSVVADDELDVLDSRRDCCNSGDSPTRLAGDVEQCERSTMRDGRKGVCQKMRRRWRDRGGRVRGGTSGRYTVCDNDSEWRGEEDERHMRNSHGSDHEKFMEHQTWWVDDGDDDVIDEHHDIDGGGGGGRVPLCALRL
eukprot:GHVQ01042855.1.p1 GENE.GHVQ01042855.1~~GHVQ01042855.1.p1  ORF type:complete len:743 (+),score=166.45 GHVQ01042855.1:440-2668(+)